MDGKIILEFEKIRKLAASRMCGNSLSAFNIIIPALLYNNVYFKDNEENIVKFSSSKSYLYKDFFGNIYLIRSTFDNNEDGSLPTREQIRRSFHVAKILYEEDDYEERNYKVYINNRVPKTFLKVKEKC